LRNDAPTERRALTIELEGRSSNRFAPNALVRVYAGDAIHVREHGVRPSFASASPTEVYVGVAPSSVVDAIDVRWPSGIQSRRLDLPLDADHAPRLRVIEPWVTIAALDGEVGPVPGANADLAVRLVGHRSAPHPVIVQVDLRSADDTVVATARQAADVGRGPRAIPIRVALPAELVGSPFRWVASVRDMEGAVDQHELYPR
jgi:hypothetical protein